MRERAKPLADMDGDAGNVTGSELYLAGMNAGSHGESKTGNRVPESACAADRSCWRVEGRERPIAHGLHDSTAVPCQFAPDQAVVLLEELAPAGVTDVGGLLGGTDEVGEQHAEEDPTHIRCAPFASEELLDLVQERVGVTDPEQVLATWEFDELGVRDA